MVDGVSNVDVGSNITLLSTPTLESIQEFKIITSSYAAEYPAQRRRRDQHRHEGGRTEVLGHGVRVLPRRAATTRTRSSGTRSTNPVLREGPAPLDYHNFGYTFGGPLLPSRQKAFFFWSQEWRKIERAGSTTALVPQLAWLERSDQRELRRAGEQRDPMAVKLLEVFPAPNVGVGSFLNEDPGINNTRQEVIRVDYDLNGTTKLTGRYTHDLSKTREPGGLFFGVVVPNVANTNTLVPGQVAAFEARSSWRAAPQRVQVPVLEQQDHQLRSGGGAKYERAVRDRIPPSCTPRTTPIASPRWSSPASRLPAATQGFRTRVLQPHARRHRDMAAGQPRGQGRIAVRVRIEERVFQRRNTGTLHLQRRRRPYCVSEFPLGKPRPALWHDLLVR